MDPIGPALSERPLLIREIVPYADRRSSQPPERARRSPPAGPPRAGPARAPARPCRSGERSGAGRRPSRAKRRARAGSARSGRWRTRPGGRSPRRATALGCGGPRPGQGRPELERQACGASRSTRRRAVRVHGGAMEPLCSGRATPMASPRSRRMASFPPARCYAGDLSADELRAELERGRHARAHGLEPATGGQLARLPPARAHARSGRRHLRGLAHVRAVRGRTNAQRTVALYGGLSAIESPLQAGQAIFPEHRLFAAVDGDLNTVWLAACNLRARPLPRAPLRAAASGALHPALAPRRRSRGHRVRSRVGERRRRTGGRRGRARIASSSVTSRFARCGSGWVAVSRREEGRGGGGIAELQIPGLEVSERLLPLAAAHRLAGPTSRAPASTPCSSARAPTSPTRRGPTSARRRRAARSTR